MFEEIFMNVNFKSIRAFPAISCSEILPLHFCDILGITLILLLNFIII